MKLMLGDSKDKLKELQDESVDLLVSDPPYGMSFMGKSWDKALPDINVWKECVRVLKPGSFGFIMCIPRQDCLSRMIISLEDAGFKINFSPIYWTYATGFPKAHNVGKVLDRRQYKQDVQMFIRFDKNKPPLGIDKSGREVISWKRGVSVPPDERENGTGGISRGAVNVKQVGCWVPTYKSDNKFEGSYGGFQPKPAVEVIIVAQKPMSEKRFVDQALNNGKGITWLDDCRIPYKDDDAPSAGNRTATFGTQETISGGNGSGGYKSNNQGRFPANLLVSDDVLSRGIIEKDGIAVNTNKKMAHNWFNKENIIKDNKGYGGSGTYSRFFSLDAWAEKNLPFLIVPKANKKEKNAGLDELSDKQVPGNNGDNRYMSVDSAGNRNIITKNNHPTVKPIKLMSYLITMGSREGDTVLDPFMGSGSTGCAAVLLRRNFIGVEKEEDYIEIAESRIEYWSKKSDQEKLF